MRNIIIKDLIQTPIEEQEIEIVERKGIGHPDSLSDGIAESVSQALSKTYLEKFDGILHHNTDEVQITAGESAPEFSGGEIIKPIDILLTGRGIAEIDGIKIGLDRVAIEAAKEYLNENILNLCVETCTVVECKIGHGSGDLVHVFGRNRDAVPSSNDTSFGVGYAPFSETENIVMETELMLNSPEFKRKYPEVGEDIKVMGLREKNKITLTIAIAMISQYVDDIDHYINVRDEIKSKVLDLASKYTSRNVETYINTADSFDSANSSVYLTVTGTSAEMGDDGSVGRGNRANGLITPNRPMSMEATSGKNPINHVGKIYNLLSNEMAKDVTKEVEGVKQIHIMTLSQIGKPIDQPKAASAQIITEDGYSLNSVKSDVESIMDSWLENINKITDMLVEGKLRTF